MAFLPAVMGALGTVGQVAGGIGAAASLFGGHGGGGGGVGQIGSGAANIVGGLLSANEAERFGLQVAQTADPYALYRGQAASQLANQAGMGIFGNGNNTAAVDPALQFASNSNGLTGALNGGQIGNQIMDLINHPDSIYNTAQYKAAFDQGSGAVNAQLAAQGLNASGNQLAALQKYGQSFGSQAYANQLSQLSGLYGQALGANQQQYGELSDASRLAMANRDQMFNEAALMSGAATGSPAAAAAAQAQIFGNVGSAGQSIGTGVGQVASGIGNFLNNVGQAWGAGRSNYNTGTLGYNSGLFGPGGGVDAWSRWTPNPSGNQYGFHL
jgi:hypothetical protein